MRASSIFSRFSVALIASAMLVACSSTPTEDDTSATDQQVERDADTRPVTPAEPTRPDYSHIPLTAEGYHNHPSHYDGTTNTRVIYFAFDRSEVPAAAFDSLRAHANHLKRNSNARIRLEGHTDERGTREYNVALGERRSKAVEQFLRVQGVSASQIETVSYGEEKPAARGSDEMSWAKNRRVELNYTAGRP
ncbi:peptidoglycan-associated lipoprotein Pal [Isoalcanivorax indicus]|uniref:peptidoglycan-associated lipoprotein Pal n=1 Tax=Isoalcanivorax indicus TaxID=2202653 RepID=UPI000DB8F9CE|nr:peptidoglycan-associated lipoprotein Pal [Isoalcanivorax indicus]